VVDECNVGGRSPYKEIAIIASEEGLDQLKTGLPIWGETSGASAILRYTLRMRKRASYLVEVCSSLRHENQFAASAKLRPDIFRLTNLLQRLRRPSSPSQQPTDLEVERKV
jgi:hypothetical protein